MSEEGRVEGDPPRDWAVIRKYEAPWEQANYQRHYEEVRLGPRPRIDSTSQRLLTQAAFLKMPQQ